MTEMLICWKPVIIVVHVFSSTDIIFYFSLTIFLSKQFIDNLNYKILWNKHDLILNCFGGSRNLKLKPYCGYGLWVPNLATGSNECSSILSSQLTHGFIWNVDISIILFHSKIYLINKSSKSCSKKKGSKTLILYIFEGKNITINLTYK